MNNHRHFIAIVVAVLSVECLQAQPLKAIAGLDQSMCTAADTLVLGATPASAGGRGNITYTWDIHPKPALGVPGSSGLVYASDFLNDTNLANLQTVKYWW